MLQRFRYDPMTVQPADLLHYNMLWLPACAQSECHAYRLVILIKGREGGSFKEDKKKEQG